MWKDGNVASTCRLARWLGEVGFGEQRPWNFLKEGPGDWVAGEEREQAVRPRQPRSPSSPNHRVNITPQGEGELPFPAPQRQQRPGESQAVAHMLWEAALPKAARPKIQPDMETQGFEDYPWRLTEAFPETCPQSSPVWGVLSHSRRGGVGRERRTHPPQTGGRGPGCPPAKARWALHPATGSHKPLPAQILLTCGLP